MTDNEIIKALEYCTEKGYCRKCPSYENSNYCKIEYEAIDLINRQKAEKEALIAGQETLQRHIAEQKAEIERYRAAMPDLEQKDDDFCGVVCRFAEGLIEKAKAEAVKEFAERLKETKFKHGSDYMIYAENIDIIKKEMVGDG